MFKLLISELLNYWCVGSVFFKEISIYSSDVQLCVGIPTKVVGYNGVTMPDLLYTNTVLLLGFTYFLETIVITLKLLENCQC